MHAAIAKLLATQGVVILDGAQGTELERRGVDLAGSRLWSAQLLIDNPDLVREITLDYLRAGSDIVTTFTYQASVQGFAAAGVDAPRAAQLLNLAVDLAHQARQAFLEEQQQQQEGRETGEGHGRGPRAAGPLIAFSCGSYGAYLADGSEFRGDYADRVSTEQLMDFHRARLEPVRGRREIDLLAFETVPCWKEAVAIVRLLREERYGKPAWVSFSCKDEVHTCHGESLAGECVPVLLEAGAEVVFAMGVNCTAPQHVGKLLEGARAALGVRQGLRGVGDGQGEDGRGSEGRQGEQGKGEGLLLLTYPNSGEEWDGEHKCWRRDADDVAAPERYAQAAAGWVRQGGAALVGGCCRTGPEHVRQLRQALCREQLG